MASSIPRELMPALDALYAAPTSASASSPPGSSGGGGSDAERRHAAERWLVAFQASDAAWKVRTRGNLI